MSLWGWLTGRNKSATAQSKLGQRVAKQVMESAHQAKMRGRPAFQPKPPRTRIPSNLGNLTHIDAGFDGDELAAFLLGIGTPCRSSWIDSARWDESASNLILTIDGKGYDFPGIDYEAAQVFAHYPSKGKWFWQVYRGRSGPGGGVVNAYVVDEGMRLPRQR